MEEWDLVQDSGCSLENELRQKEERQGIQLGGEMGVLVRKDAGLG